MLCFLVLKQGQIGTLVSPWPSPPYSDLLVFLSLTFYPLVPIHHLFSHPFSSMRTEVEAFHLSPLLRIFTVVDEGPPDALSVAVPPDPVGDSFSQHFPTTDDDVRISLFLPTVGG